MYKFYVSQAEVRLILDIIKPIKETIYLSAENYKRYRIIIRILFYNYEKMRYWLSVEEIFEEISEFYEYGIDSLKQDLMSLENWGNLISIQDTAKTRTLEEFKNRKFRYKISEITVAFERTLIQLENQSNSVKGSLEVSLIERFRETLKEINNLEDDKIYSWWQNLNTDFKQLNENYQDYISKFDFKLNDLSNVTEFLIYKERFVKYLNGFIVGIQENSIFINEILNSIEEDKLESIIDKIVEYETDTMINDNLKNKEIYKGRFLSMKQWFISTNKKSSMVDILLERTNEIIRKITRYAYQIADMNTVNALRKDDYKNIIEIFHDAKDVCEAHKLSSLIFGVFNTKHIVFSSERETESIKSSTYEEKSEVVTIIPRIRNYREKTANKVSIKDNSISKKELLMKTLSKREDERKNIEAKIINNSLKFRELPVLTKEERLIFLSWLSKALNKNSEWIKNEYGHFFKLKNDKPKNNITLKCVDGEFNMPDFEIVFKEGRICD